MANSSKKAIDEFDERKIELQNISKHFESLNNHTDFEEQSKTTAESRKMVETPQNTRRRQGTYLHKELQMLAYQMTYEKVHSQRIYL